MKEFVTSDNSQLALIYIQKGDMFRQLKGFKALALQVNNTRFVLGNNVEISHKSLFIKILPFVSNVFET